MAISLGQHNTSGIVALGEELVAKFALEDVLDQVLGHLPAAAVAHHNFLRVVVGDGTHRPLHVKGFRIILGHLFFLA